MITKDQVEEARREYYSLREQYFQERTEVVRLRRIPDEYLAQELSCVEFIDTMELVSLEKENAWEVLKNGVPVGQFQEEYYTNYPSCVYCSVFTAYDAVEIQYVN